MRSDDESRQVVGYRWVSRRGIYGVNSCITEDQPEQRKGTTEQHIPAILKEIKVEERDSKAADQVVNCYNSFQKRNWFTTLAISLQIYPADWPGVLDSSLLSFADMRDSFADWQRGCLKLSLLLARLGGESVTCDGM